MLVLVIEIPLAPNSQRRTPNVPLKKTAGKGHREENRGQSLVSGAVRTSVTLLGQNMGNTMSIIVYAFSVSFAGFFGRISARIKFRVAKSTWPSKEAAEPNFHHILCDCFETNGPTAQTRAKEERLTF